MKSPDLGAGALVALTACLTGAFRAVLRTTAFLWVVLAAGLAAEAFGFALPDALLAFAMILSLTWG